MSKKMERVNSFDKKFVKKENTRMLPRLKSGKGKQNFLTFLKGACCDHCWCLFDIDRSQLLG